MAKYTYIFLMAFTFLGPFIMSFEKQINFKSQWTNVFKSILPAGLIFLVWDYFYTLWGVWSFNSEYISGIKILNLPIEEISFFFIVPFACLFMYETVHFLLKMPLNSKILKIIHEILALALIFVGLVFWDRLYTSVTFIISAISIYYLNSSKHSNILHKFSFAYLFCLVPFLLVNGVLTYLPVVIYNDLENLGIRIISIPFEDIFYGYLLLVWSVVYYESLKLQTKNKSLKTNQ